MNSAPSWQEVYLGGTVEAEESLFLNMARRIARACDTTFRNGLTGPALPMLHAKSVAGIADARLVVDANLPRALAFAHFRPAATIPALVRFSNAAGVVQSDAAPDVRGLSVRLVLPRDEVHDLFLVNAPASIARDASQYLALATAALHGGGSLLAELAARLGEEESHRVATFLKTQLAICSSVADENYWSGCAYLWADRPVRYALRPLVRRGWPVNPYHREFEALRLELAIRLLRGDVRFRLAIEEYVDERSTPVEDASIDWLANGARVSEIGTLILPRQNILGEDGAAALARIHAMDFDRWNAPPGFRPLGSLNRLLRIAPERRPVSTEGFAND